MDSTASILIIVAILGFVVLGAIWAFSRNRGSIDVPPAKLDESAVTPAQPRDGPAAGAKIISSPPEPDQAPEPAKKPKAAPTKVQIARKTAPKKGAAKPATPSAQVPQSAIGVAGAVGPPDNLLQIKGLGPKLNTLLDGLGIARFDQIAAWSAEDVAKVDEHLGAFKGRIERDSWIEQAGFLAKGAIAEFEAKFGKLDSENK